MTMTAKPKSKKLQMREKVIDLLDEVSEFTFDARMALYNYGDKLSNRSKRRVCILERLKSELETLEKYIDDIEVEVVFKRAEQIFNEAQLLSKHLNEEVDSIEK